MRRGSYSAAHIGARPAWPSARSRWWSRAAVAVAAAAAADKSEAAANGFNAGVTGVRNASTKTGGTLNLIADGDCDSYDPARTYYGHCWDMQRLFSRGLMAYKPVPGTPASTSFPTWRRRRHERRRRKTWTYKLRSGLKFEDGTPITSKDVKYAHRARLRAERHQRWPDVRDPSCARQLDARRPRLLQGPVQGQGPEPPGSVDHRDAGRPDHRLPPEQPFGDWNYIMALPASTPVPIAYDQSAKGGANYTFHPVVVRPVQVRDLHAGQVADARPQHQLGPVAPTRSARRCRTRSSSPSTPTPTTSTTA